VAFSYGYVWEANQVKVDPDIDIDFDLNCGGADAKNSTGVSFDKHNEP
jgi:hypothetical protein